MDNDDFCSYEQAVLLRKLGFDRVCSEFWRTSFCIDGKPNRNRKTKHLPKISMAPASNSELESLNENLITAPTLAKAQKWLREEKQIVVLVDYSFVDEDTLVYSYDIYQYIPEGFGRCKDGVDFWKITHSLHVYDTYSGDYETYESALSAGIDAALKLIDEGEE